MEAQKMIEILRRVRHDFGNHLQVISGYIELGRVDKVKDYLREVLVEMSWDRPIFESVPAEAALYFYEQVLLAKDLGVILIYENIKLKKTDLLEANQEPYKSLSKLTNDLTRKNEIMVYLSIKETTTGIEMSFKCSQLQESPWYVKINRE